MSAELLRVTVESLICDIENCKRTPYWRIAVGADGAPTFPGGSRTLFVCDHHRMTEQDAIRGWCFKHKAECLEVS